MKLFGKKNKEADPFEDYPAIGAVMATKLITEQKRKPMFLYREKPMNEQDSGWRIFSGQESQEYTDDPANTGIYAPTTIFKIDASIAELLLNPVGSVFERKNEKSPWYEVDDYDLGDEIVRQKMTADSSIALSDLFMRRVDEGDLVFVMKGKTVRVSVWNDKGKTKQQLYDEHVDLQKRRASDEVPMLETFDLSDEQVSRTGYMIEESDEDKSYKVIYGFSMVDEKVVMSALYFDKDEDKVWALDTWKSIRFEK